MAPVVTVWACRKRGTARVIANRAVAVDLAKDLRCMGTTPSLPKFVVRLLPSIPDAFSAHCRSNKYPEECDHANGDV
jgi:hypothetical protein